MLGNVKHYFAGGNTARGFYSLYDSAFGGLDRLFILRGGSGTGKTTIVRSIAEHMTKQGMNIELYHSSSDNDALDGVVIPMLKAGILGVSVPSAATPKAARMAVEYINLDDLLDTKQLEESREEIERLSLEIGDTLWAAYSTFAEALSVHDDWEKIYIDHTDFAASNQVAEQLIERLLGDTVLSKEPSEKHRFLGAATPNGAVDYIENITIDIDRRFLLKGRPGTGKSTLLKKLAQAAKQRGYDVEMFHCGFDPHSIDMVLLQELSVAVFDSTAPHEYEPDRESDEVIDMYVLTVAPGIDEAYAEQIAPIARQYKEKMQEAISLLTKAKSLKDEHEALYVPAMDFNQVNQIVDELRNEFDRLR